MNEPARFQELKRQHKIAEDAVLSDFFDSLPPVRCEEILSKWRGGGFDTGHWLFKALIDMRWYGKWFQSIRDAMPLVCFNDRGQLYSNRLLNGEASLCMTEFRGTVSAAVAYDGEPMFGHFRKVDNDTLLGIVSGKTLSIGKDVVESGRHQYFYLERVSEFPVEFVTHLGLSRQESLGQVILQEA